MISYELLEALKVRLKLVLPLTLLAVVALFCLQFRNAIEVAIIMLSIPFALVALALSTYPVQRRGAARRSGARALRPVLG